MIVGKYEIPQEARDNVSKILDELQKPYYAGDPGTVFIIQLYFFKLDGTNVTFNGNPRDQMINKKMFYDRDNYLTYLREQPIETKLQTKQSFAVGINLVCYVVNNILKTISLTRTSIPDKMIQKGKEMFSRFKVIYIKDPFTELDNYMDIDRFKNTLSKPSIQKPKEPEEPQMTEKERKLLAYKEKSRIEREKQERLWKYKKR